MRSTSLGHVPLAGDAAPGAPLKPKLDGTDPWPLRERDEAPGLALTFESRRAYVNKLRLVAYFDEALTPLTNAYFDANNAVVAADVVFDPTQQAYRLENGLIAGYSKTDTLLQVIPRITTEFPRRRPVH